MPGQSLEPDTEVASETTLTKQQILSNNFMEVPPYRGTGLPTDSTSVLEIAAITKDPELMVTHVTDDIQKMVMLLANKKGEPNLFQQDLSLVMTLGQALHQIEELISIRIMFYQQLTDQAKGALQAIDNPQYAELQAVAPEPPPFDEIDGAIHNAHLQLQKSREALEALSQERRGLAEEFRKRFEEVKSHLIQSLSASSPEERKTFLENLSEFIAEREASSITIDPNKKAELEARVEMYDVYLRWQANEIASQHGLKADGTWETPLSDNEKLLWLAELDRQNQLRKATSDEKLKFQTFKELGKATKALDIQEKALYDKIKGIQSFSEAATAPHVSEPEQTTLAAMATLMVADTLGHPKRPTKTASQKAPRIPQLDGLLSSANAISEKLKTAIQKANTLEQTINEIRSQLDQSVRSKNLPDFVARIRTLQDEFRAREANLALTSRPAQRSAE